MKEIMGVAFGLDGVVVKPGADKVPQEVVERFSNLPSDFFAVVVTGRPKEQASPIIRQLGLGHREHIVANGGRFINTGDSSNTQDDEHFDEDKPYRSIQTYRKSISPEKLAEIQAAAQEISTDVDYRSLQLWIDGDNDPRHKKTVEDHAVRETSAAFIMGVPDHASRILIDRLVEIKGITAFSNDVWGDLRGETIGIYHEEANKGTALTKLLDFYGISPDQMIGVAEGPNDLGIFEAVGEDNRIAMGNAIHAVKKQAKFEDILGYEVPPQSGNGILKVINKYTYNPDPNIG